MRIHHACCLLAVTTVLRAQDDATTLSALCARAEAVVVARPLSVGEVHGDLRNVRFGQRAASLLG